MDIKTKILIVEHDDQDVELLQKELAKGGINYVSTIVDNELDFFTALTTFKPDIILSDYSLPSFDGPSAFRMRQELLPDTPFLFVTGAIGEETSVELMKNGVTDFVLKNKLFTLCHKIDRALVESKDRQLKNKAEHDLSRSESLLSKAQQLAHMGSWEFDFATNDIRYSDETFRICGLTPCQSRQSLERALTFVHPEDIASVLKKLKRSPHFLRKFSTNFRIVQKNGATRHIYLEGRLNYNAAVKPSGLHGIVQDVTEIVLLENKLAEERLARQNEVTQAIITAQESERAYIGRELHENINQILAVTNLYIERANHFEEDRMINLDKCHKMIANAIEEIRKISKTLIIPTANMVGLFGNIRNLLSDLKLIHPIKLNFLQDNIREALLSEKLQLTIFRIVQEQVNNILKHSQATKATIKITRIGKQVVLLVSDNGNGCDVTQKRNGVGILNIRSRAQAYLGNVCIVSKPGEGYKLKVVLPLNVENLLHSPTLIY